MLYTSTRDKSVKVTSAQAIAQGISKDGGLFVPESIPAISKEFVDSLVGLDYISRAKKVLSLYLTDYTEDEIDMCVSGAYAKGKFSSDKVSPIKTIAEGKMPDLNAFEIEKAMSMVAGTARSMGIAVSGDKPF